jgi:hypothetical protein
MISRPRVLKQANAPSNSDFLLDLFPPGLSLGTTRKYARALYRERKLISRLGVTGRENSYHDSVQCIFYHFLPHSVILFGTCILKALLSVIYFSESRSKIQKQIKIMSEIYLAYSVIFTRQDLRSNRDVLQLHMDLEKMKQITI